MRWNLRMKAAEQGIWKSTEMRRRLAEAGLEISAGKMSALWTGTPTTVRLDDLDIICAVLSCTTADLLIHEPEVAAAAGRSAKRRPRRDLRQLSRGSGAAEPSRRSDDGAEDLPEVPRAAGSQSPLEVLPPLPAATVRPATVSTVRLDGGLLDSVQMP